MSSTKIYIGDLGNDGSEREIEDAFSRYGKLTEVWVAKNPSGFAFVHMTDPRDADEAVHRLDGSRLCGHRVRVEISKSRPRRGGGRGYGGGGGGGYGGGRFGGGRGRDYRQDRYRDSRWVGRVLFHTEIMTMLLLLPLLLLLFEIFYSHDGLWPIRERVGVVVVNHQPLFSLKGFDSYIIVPILQL